jgi:alanine-glyoxylate transaminase/serine-glyoxylate transaminase/serine-pyruvate transaminase
MLTPVIGYLDPELLKCMDEISEMLKNLFQTKNRMTLAISATGSSGMEASFANFVEPGDTVIVGVNGFFSERMTEVAGRCGAQVIGIDQEWGKIIEPERVIKVLKENQNAKICALVHAETSTGVRQPLEEIGAYCKKGDTLFVVDAVTSLGAGEVKVDEWGMMSVTVALRKELAFHQDFRRSP